ncbi:MAG: acyltransferase [Candidatus Omnitrophota bacterium]
MAEYQKHDKALIADGAQIGAGTRIWAFANIQPGAVIGRDCNICDGCFIEDGAVLGDQVTTKNGVNVFKGITLEKGVFCGTNVAFINDRFPRSGHSGRWKLESTVVRQGATIGANAVVMCGLTIGEYAFVGAGSVVTRDVAPYMLVWGNPAEPRGFVCSCGRRLNNNLACECGKRFERDGSGLRPGD